MSLQDANGAPPGYTSTSAAATPTCLVMVTIHLVLLQVTVHTAQFLWIGIYLQVTKRGGFTFGLFPPPHHSCPL
jgi:hypothetical protein